MRQKIEKAAKPNDETEIIECIKAQFRHSVQREDLYSNGMMSSLENPLLSRIMSQNSPELKMQPSNSTKFGLLQPTKTRAIPKEQANLLKQSAKDTNQWRQGIQKLVLQKEKKLR